MQTNLCTYKNRIMILILQHSTASGAGAVGSKPNPIGPIGGRGFGGTQNSKSYMFLLN